MEEVTTNVEVSADVADELSVIAPQEAQTTEPAAQETQTPEQTQEALNAEALYELKVNGQAKTLPLSKILALAQQGDSYAQKMHEFHLERARFEEDRKRTQSEAQKMAELEQKLSRYSEVDNYIKQNPDWWSTVQAEYQRKLSDQGFPASPAFNQLRQEYDAKLKEITEQIAPLTAELNAQQIAIQNRVLDEDISSFKAEYPDLDWNAVDANGLNLQNQILKKYVELGLDSGPYKPGNFRLVARDMLFDSIVKRQELKAKESLGKDIKKAAKQGLGPITDKPQLKMEKLQNVRKKSWDDVEKEILNELSA